jgi:very-short-patch-repair endonuclease
MTTDDEKDIFVPTLVSPHLIEAARSLRRTMTDAEQLLWSSLRRKQLGGYRFRRQHPIDRFVLDFYCSEVKLAIELDGGQHNEPDAIVYDHERTVLLKEYGIQIVRFWNHEILSNLEGVLQIIFERLTTTED